MNKTKIILNLCIIFSLCSYLPAEAMLFSLHQGGSQAQVNLVTEHRIAIPKSACLSILALFGGITGLTIITKTFQQLLKHNRQVQAQSSKFNAKSLGAKSLGLYGLGFGTGVAFLASSIILLKNNLGI